MKKLYFLDEEERKRILTIHENATKNQYLKESNSLISEGYYNTVDLKNLTLTLHSYLEMERDGSGSELRLEKGVVFKKENANGLIASNVNYSLVGDYTGGVEEKGKGNVRYSCKTKKFSIEGRNATFFGENFAAETTKNFDDLCKGILNANANLDKSKMGLAQLGVNTGLNAAQAGLNSMRQKNISIVYCGLKNGVITANNEYKGRKWDDYVKDFSITNQDIETAKKSCSNTGGKPSGGSTSKLAPRVQEIQKSLGIQNPTGKLDIASLQAMLTKLNGNPQAQPVSTLTPTGVVSQTQQPQVGTSPEQLQAALQQLTQNIK